MNQFSSFKGSVVVIALHWRVDNYPWTALSGKDCLSSELGCLYCSPDISWLLFPLVTSLNVSQQSRYGFSMETYRLQLWWEMGVRSYQKPIPKPSPILQYAPNPSSIYVKIRWWNQIHSKMNASMNVFLHFLWQCARKWLIHQYTKLLSHL